MKKGSKMSLEMKRRISKKLLGHKHSEETRKKIGFASLGRINSEKQKDIARNLFIQNNPMKDPVNREKGL